MSSVVSTLLIVMLWAVIMSLVTVIMLAFGVWLSSKGQSIRNASGFLLALGASYSVSFVVDIIVLAWLGRIHLFGNTTPIMTWLIISIVFLLASLRAKPSPVAIALAFVLNGLVASATGIVDYENLVVGLSLLAMVPVVYLLARSQGISADSSASAWQPREHTDQDNLRWSWLRAVEWGRWPIFLSQPFAPIFLIWISWQAVLVAVFCLNIAWSLFVRYKFVSITAATLGADIVSVKWVAWPVATAYMFMQARYPECWVALAWPLLIFVLGIITPTRIGRIQTQFMRALGYEPSALNSMFEDRSD